MSTQLELLKKDLEIGDGIIITSYTDENGIETYVSEYQGLGFIHRVESYFGIYIKYLQEDRPIVIIPFPKEEELNYDRESKVVTIKDSIGTMVFKIIKNVD